MYRACMRSVIDYAAPAFSNGQPQYLKNELVRLEKRTMSIVKLALVRMLSFLTLSRPRGSPLTSKIVWR